MQKVLSFLIDEDEGVGDGRVESDWPQTQCTVLSLPPFYGARIHFWAYQVENDHHMWDEATGQHHTHDIYSTYVEVANKADNKQIDLY